jgi:hypothetical protein
MIRISSNGRPVLFSEKEVDEISGFLYRVTAEAATKIDHTLSQFDSDEKEIQSNKELSNKISSITQEWMSTVKKVGGKPTKLWKIEFSDRDNPYRNISWEYQHPLGRQKEKLGTELF